MEMYLVYHDTAELDSTPSDGSFYVDALFHAAGLTPTGAPVLPASTFSAASPDPARIAAISVHFEVCDLLIIPYGVPK